MNAPALPSKALVDRASLTRRLASATASQLPAAIAETRRMMTPATPDRIAHRAARLLSHYWQPEEAGHDTEARLADWAEVLSIYPDWAIRAAMTEFQRTAGNKRPTPALIAAHCRDQVQPVIEELARASSVLDRINEERRPEPSAESKARIAAMVAAATKRMGS